MSASDGISTSPGKIEAEELDLTRGNEQTEALLAEFEAERPARKLSGLPRHIVAAAGVGLSCYALYWVLDPIPALLYRSSFLGIALAMTFAVYRARASREAVRGAPASDNPGWLDLVPAVLSLIALFYPVIFINEFIRRAVRPSELDLLFGILTVVLVLEATRRTVGWILPCVCLGFMAYAFLGQLIPAGYLLGHRGYGIERLIGQSYIGIEGIFGVPIAVAATYIVLFTIYGAVLEYSGVGKYFIDVSFAAFGESRTAPGRTVTLAGFLLGTVSGSGVATTVTLGSFSWPILRRAGYPPEEGGGILAAAGIGAILSPPTLGAAAFIIAEFLGVSYLQVLIYATIPTVLYYLGIILAIEVDSRRFNTRALGIKTPPLGYLLKRFGYHFSSLFLIVILMAIGMSPFLAVSYSILAACLLSFLHRDTRMTPPRIWEALAAGAMSMLPVAATCAAAGIIVAVVTLTGLGLKASSIIVFLSGGSLALTAIFSAIAVMILGLAVPVTASFIIAAVIIGPALTTLGVEPFAAYMFIFYYAVLSEVSPPTALSAVAAAAITGGNVFKTMMRVWKYSLPAFLVPFAFVLSPNGEGVLMKAPVQVIVWTFVVSTLAVAALAVVTGGWIVGPAGWVERGLAAVAAALLLYLEPLSVIVGLIALGVAVAMHVLRNRATRSEETTEPRPPHNEVTSKEASR
ncbi:MAG: TRAP transporter permease [Actinomycetota bacterium]